MCELPKCALRVLTEDSAVASAIFYGMICWGSSITAADSEIFDNLIEKVGFVLGCPLDPSAGGGRKEDNSHYPSWRTSPTLCVCHINTETEDIL